LPSRSFWLPSILMSWRIFCGAISVIIGRIVQVCFLQFYCQTPILYP
jgi:hypothetical protein